MDNPSFVHVVNFFAGRNDTDKKIMHTTAKTIIAAKQQTQATVTLLAAVYEEDKTTVPQHFIAPGFLTQSLKDFLSGNDVRKLPLLREILQLAYTHSTAEYVILTNSDICLMPWFYTVVEKHLQAGHDALIINRRRISNVFLDVDDLNLQYSEAGKPHPGFDCFVFKRELIPQLNLHNVCTGLPHAENLLAHHLFIKTTNCKLISDAHLTYHIGMALHNNWGSAAHIRYNKKQFIGELKKMRKDIRIENFPGAELSFLKRHFKWLMNPSFHYPTMCMADLRQLNKPRRKNTKKEKLSFKNRYFDWLLKRVIFE